MTDVVEAGSPGGLTAETIEKTSIGGQRVYSVEGRGLMIEDKDWKLLRSQISTSILSKGWKGELFWGSIGLVAGLFPQIVELAGSQLGILDVIYIIGFSAGIIGIIDAVVDWLVNRKRNIKHKGDIDEFLNDIESRNNFHVDKK